MHVCPHLSCRSLYPLPLLQRRGPLSFTDMQVAISITANTIFRDSSCGRFFCTVVHRVELTSNSSESVSCPTFVSKTFWIHVDKQFFRRRGQR